MFNVDMIVGKKDNASMKSALASDVSLRWIALVISLPLVLLYNAYNKGIVIWPFFVIFAVMSLFNIAYHCLSAVL